MSDLDSLADHLTALSSPIWISSSSGIPGPPQAAQPASEETCSHSTVVSESVLVLGQNSPGPYFSL